MNKGNVPASEKQLDELRIAVQKAVNKLRGRINARTAQEWIGNGKALDSWAEKLMPNLSESSEPITRLLSGGGLILPATTGGRTIAQAAHIFPGGIDLDFARWNVPSAPTPATHVAVHELLRNSDFGSIFGDSPACFTQDQVVTFNEVYPAWLHPNGQPTFFPLMVDGERLVVRVRRWRSAGGLVVYLSRLTDDYIWNNEDRPRLVRPLR